jgi:cell division transport system ATP-binding protein
MTMISFSHVAVVYDSHRVLHDISFKVEPGQFVFLVGQTGSGKTTLLRLISMDILPTKGIVTVGKYSSRRISPRELPFLRRTLGTVFQDFKLMGDRSVFENVAFTLHVTGTKGTEIKKKVMHTLADVGLTHARNMRVQELSGGEQQRVAIARAFVHNPLVLLADEPTGNLDPGTSAEILQLLFDINTRGTAVIMATHNYELTRKAKQRILRLEEGGVRQVEKA